MNKWRDDHWRTTMPIKRLSTSGARPRVPEVPYRAAPTTLGLQSQPPARIWTRRYLPGRRRLICPRSALPLSTCTRIEPEMNDGLSLSIRFQTQTTLTKKKKYHICKPKSHFRVKMFQDILK